jgi:hypothetical protein
VIAGLTLRDETVALDFEGPADDWRVIGNDMSCPDGTGSIGCVNGGSGSPDPAAGTSDCAAVYVAGETDTGADGNGAIEVYSNTVYNCGSRANGDSAAFVNGGGVGERRPPLVFRNGRAQ